MITIEKEKSGVVQFRNQKEIIADRQKRTQLEYQELQKRVGNIIKTNYHLSQTNKK